MKTFIQFAKLAKLFFGDYKLKRFIFVSARLQICIRAKENGLTGRAPVFDL